MLRADGTIDERTDVYLLGATLHRMLTGKALHDGNNLYEVLASALKSEPKDYADDIPEELAEICNKATAKEPADRFASAAELRDAVAGFLRHKASLDLAAEAAKLQQQLQRQVAEGSSYQETRSVFAECRFAHRQALREWPGNEQARAGLQQALRLMCTAELDQGHLAAAEALLGELDEPAPELRERLRRAREDEAAEQQRVQGLRHLAFEVDAGVASTPRAMLIAFLAVLCVIILAVGLSGMGPKNVYDRAVWTMPPFIIVLAGFAFFRRATLFSNRASRQLMAIVAITIGVLTLHRGLAYVARPTFRFLLSSDLLFLATGGACLAATASRRLWAAAIVWALGGCALIFYSGEPLHIFGPSAALGAALLALAWWKQPVADDAPASREDR
jgi:serine/threonine-protein kinase